MKYFFIEVDIKTGEGDYKDFIATKTRNKKKLLQIIKKNLCVDENPVIDYNMERVQDYERTIKLNSITEITDTELQVIRKFIFVPIY